MDERKRNFFLNQMTVIVLAVAFFHVGALLFGWYIKFWWWDIMNHLLGGFFIGLAFLWFLSHSGYVGNHFFKNKTLKVFSAVSFTLFIAVAWEYYEYLLGFRYYPEGYISDTIKDVCMGFLGSFLASMYFFLADNFSYGQSRE